MQLAAWIFFFRGHEAQSSYSHLQYQNNICLNQFYGLSMLTLLNEVYKYHFVQQLAEPTTYLSDIMIEITQLIIGGKQVHSSLHSA